MDFDVVYDQLTPVAGSVRAGIVTYDRDNPIHQDLLRVGIPHFLGSLGAIHGESFPQENLEAVIDAINGDIAESGVRAGLK